MTGGSRAVMADWLALHGLSAGICLQLLAPVAAPLPRRVADPAYAGPPPWPAVLTAFAAALPQSGSSLDRIRAGVQIDFAPDLSRFPVPFTLHRGGAGLPFMSCPLEGRLSDLLVLAHELGHACQFLASGRTDLSPVQRETAACLAERLVLPGLMPIDPAIARLQAARDARLLVRGSAILRRALDDPASPYDNAWNYPIARSLAARAALDLPPADLWQIFTADRSLADLLRLAPAARSGR